jgi:hypothetical protein
MGFMYSKAKLVILIKRTVSVASCDCSFRVFDDALAKADGADVPSKLFMLIYI